MNTTAEILNAASVCIGALIGALGVVYDFKDKTGRITVWGRWAISCIVATGVIAITTQIIKVRTDIAADKAAEKKAAEVSELERRIHNPLGRFVASIELQVPKYRLGGIASPEQLREKIAKLTIHVAITRATITDDHAGPLPTSLEFELIPFEDARPSFLLSRHNAPTTTFREHGDSYELDLGNLVPVVDKLTPEITGWSDLDIARVYVGVDGLEPPKENARPGDIYTIRRFSIRNERGMEQLMGQRDFALFQFRERYVYSSGGERVEFPEDHEYAGTFPGEEPLP